MFSRRYDTRHDQSEKQDFSQDTTKLVRPQRTIEERSGGIFIKKSENLQSVPDHYAEVAHSVKLGVGLKDGERWHDFWFPGPIMPANRLEEYEAFMIAYVQERIMELSPTLAAPILLGTCLSVYSESARRRT
jgi:hypothetical protein